MVKVEEIATTYTNGTYEIETDANHLHIACFLAPEFPGYLFRGQDMGFNPGGQSGNFWYTPNGYIGPGSGNHWSDGYRSEYGNFLLMNTQTFNATYGSDASKIGWSIWSGDSPRFEQWRRGEITINMVRQQQKESQDNQGVTNAIQNQGKYIGSAYYSKTESGKYIYFGFSDAAGNQLLFNPVLINSLGIVGEILVGDEDQAGGGWDLNGDGIFQKNEADNWWLNGKGVGVTVDNSKINWTGLQVPKGLSSGDTFAISTTDAFRKLPYETAATYGGTSFEVVGPSQVIVLDQLYHYNYRPNNSTENRVRNLMTWFGRPSGEGINFMIYYSNPNIWIK